MQTFEIVETTPVLGFSVSALRKTSSDAQVARYDMGIAVVSPLDPFDHATGLRLASGRAHTAIRPGVLRVLSRTRDDVDHLLLKLRVIDADLSETFVRLKIQTETRGDPRLLAYPQITARTHAQGRALLFLMENGFKLSKRQQRQLISQFGAGLILPMLAFNTRVKAAE